RAAGSLDGLRLEGDRDLPRCHRPSLPKRCDISPSYRLRASQPAERQDGAVERHESVMAGDGYYNRHSPQHAEIGTMSEDALRRAVESLPTTLTAPVVVDYGSSQGRNSIGPMRLVLAALRARMPALAPVRVVHTDLASNDWSTLFRTVFGPDGYLD